MKNKKIKKIAFWEYDVYPYALWGEIDEERKHSTNFDLVYVKRMEGFIKPFIILEGDEAQYTIENLTHFANCKKDREDEIKTTYDNYIRGIFPKHPKFKISK